MSPKSISCFSLLKPGPILSQLGACHREHRTGSLWSIPQSPQRSAVPSHLKSRIPSTPENQEEREKMNQDVQQTQLLEEFPKAQGPDLTHSLVLF